MIDPLTHEPITRPELEREIAMIRQKIEDSTNEYEEVVWREFLVKRERLLEML